jgi:hypothetical protein
MITWSERSEPFSLHLSRWQIRFLKSSQLGKNGCSTIAQWESEKCCHQTKQAKLTAETKMNSTATKKKTSLKTTKKSSTSRLSRTMKTLSKKALASQTTATTSCLSTAFNIKNLTKTRRQRASQLSRSRRTKAPKIQKKSQRKKKKNSNLSLSKTHSWCKSTRNFKEHTALAKINEKVPEIQLAKSWKMRMETCTSRRRVAIWCLMKAEWIFIHW